MRRPTADPPVRCMPPIGLSPAPSFRIRHAHHAATAAAATATTATPTAHGAFCDHPKAVSSFCPRQYKTYLKQLFPVLDNKKPAAAAMSAGQATTTTTTTAAAAAAAADHDDGHDHHHNSHESPTTSSSPVHQQNHTHSGPPPTTSSTTTYTPSHKQPQPQYQSLAQLPPQQQLQQLQLQQQQQQQHIGQQHLMSTLEAGGTHVPMHLPELPQVGSDRAWVIVKIVFRAVCLVIGLGLLAITVYSWVRLRSRGGLASALLPIGMFATGWNASEFITMGCRWRRDQHDPNRTSRRPRGLPAKAHVGCELLLCIGGVVGAVFQGIVSLHPRYPPPPDAIGAITLLIFLGMFEFVLFVRSCVEVDRRKKDRRIQQLVIALQIQQQQNLQMHQQQQQQQAQQQAQQQRQAAMSSSSPPSETAPSSWGQAPESMSEYDRELRELNTKYFGPMPEPPEDPRDLQKVLIIAPHLRGIVG